MSRTLTYRTRPSTAPFTIHAFEGEGSEAVAHDEAFAEPIAVARAKALSRDHGYAVVHRAGTTQPAYRFVDGVMTA